MASMTTVPGLEAGSKVPTIADLLEQLGVPPDRVLLRPSPVLAKIEDVVAVHDREKRLCELVNGVLVEKAMGFKESRLALVLGYLLELYLKDHDLGIVLGADGMLQLNPNLVRIPDLSFISWDQLPGRAYPVSQIPALYPDLAVEVLNQSNTPAEMERKLRDYFAAGSKLVWYLDPVERSARAYTAPEQFTRLDESRALDEGDVLPGFRLVLHDWFVRARHPGTDA